MIKIKKLHHSAYRCKDTYQTKKFYVNFLGLKLTKAFIIDSWFDNYLGVIVLVKVISGTIQPKQKIKILSNGKEFLIDKVGNFTPKLTYLNGLGPGDVGFIIACSKVRPNGISDVKVKSVIKSLR